MSIKDIGKGKQEEFPNSIKEVDQMTGKEFEVFVNKYFRTILNYETQMTEKNDYGIDIILTDKDGQRIGVQCKNYGPKTILGENMIVKMQKGAEMYHINKSSSNKYLFAIVTNANSSQVSDRGKNYMENEEIEGYYREDIIDMLKDIDEYLGRDKSESNYINIAYDQSAKVKGTFKQNTQLVDMLKEERKKIAKYNNLFPVYLVYNDKMIEEIILKKPVSKAELLSITGFNEQKFSMFGSYLVSRLKEFFGFQNEEEQEKEASNKALRDFLSETRKKIASYNKLTPVYNVFNNKTLDEIVDKKPKTKEDLLAINGIGEVKYALWGDYLLKEINKYLK
jgi:superfamily II DNA helicase RecQ